MLSPPGKIRAFDVCVWQATFERGTDAVPKMKKNEKTIGRDMFHSIRERGGIPKGRGVKWWTDAPISLNV